MTQEIALKILQTGANVFLTGEPGSGKTHMVNQYVRWLGERGIEPAITASTGIAATHIGGMTIHSWSGIGVKKNLSSYDLDMIASNERVAKRVGRASILIIDEVSMLSAETLSMAEAVCREVRRNEAPFGGLQVILVGDFFQLPPIVARATSEGGEPRSIAERDENAGNRLGFGPASLSLVEAGESETGSAPAPFAFRSNAWQRLRPMVCYLSEQHRQEDTAFLDLLSQVRFGKTDERVSAALAARRIEEKNAPSNLPRLYSHNADVDRVNEERLASIPGAVRRFAMTAHGPDALVATLKRGCLSPEVLSLKTRARVMFTKNKPDGSFVNGTLGEVEGFAGDGMPVVETLGGRRIYVEPMEWTITDGLRPLAKIEQVPLRLAWALTVHKSQGMTLDAAVMDLSDAFEYGQGYVALSRVRSLAGLYLLGLNARALEVHPDTLMQDEEFRKQSVDARKIFEAMSPKELQTMHLNFIRACGGDPKGNVPRNAGKKKPQGSTLDATLTLLKEKKTIREIAHTRGLAESTISSHVSDLHAAGRVGRAVVERLASPHLKRALPRIHTVFKELGAEHLTPVFEKLRGAYSYADLRLARMLYNPADSRK